MTSAAISFAQRVQEWQVFYATLAGVTATLVGLLFVALFVNVDLFIRAEYQYMKRISRMVFGSFVLVLFCSLMFLIPHQNPWGLAGPIFGASLVALGDTVLTYWEFRRPMHGLPKGDRKAILQGIGRAAMGRMALLVVSVLLLTELPGLFYWIAVPILAGLFAACRNCWDLLVGARERLNH